MTEPSPSESDPRSEGATPRPRGWFRAVFGFGLASLLSDAGHEAATSALPALLASLGAPPVALGFIEGLSDALSSFAKLWGGFVANRPSWRKPITFLGYLVTGLSNGGYAFAGAWGHVLAARGGGWLARGIRAPARDTMLADAVTPETRGRAFGFHRAMDTVGAVIGPSFAALIIAKVSLHDVFLWAAVPGVLSAFAILFFVRNDRSPAPEPVPFWRSVGTLPAGFKRFLGAVFLFGIGDFARTLLILRATNLLAPHAGKVEAAAIAMALYVAHNVVYAAASFPVGTLADRFDPKRILVWGYGLGVATALLAAFATPSFAMLIALFVVAGLTLAFEDTLEKTIAAALLPKESRGIGYGVLATTNGIGDFVSSSLVGLLWTIAGAPIAFGVAAVLCAGGAIVLAATSTRSGQTI